MRVKVCGTTNREDALLAVELGAWALGFIFYPKSPRAVQAGDVPSMTEGIGAGVEKVGVFVDGSPEEVVETGRRAGLTIAQLHGREDRRDADRLLPHFKQVWKAVRIGASLPREELEAFRGYTLLLDTLVPGTAGGTGRTFSWDLAREASAYGPVILAGGLTPENVGAAIRAARPFAVDVASGVERRPGEKDPERLRAFFDAVRGL